jgi:hypothetical protein
MTSSPSRPVGHELSCGNNEREAPAKSLVGGIAIPLEDPELAVARVFGVIDAVDEARLSPMNVDLVEAKTIERRGRRPRHSLRLRRAWTKLEQAYFEVRRGIAFLRAREGDVDEILPNLRHNPGNRTKKKPPADPAQTAGAP